jgi:hypothetical protein
MPIPSIRTPVVESGTPTLPGNALLDGLPSNELDPILSVAERVRPRMRQVLIEQSFR